MSPTVLRKGGFRFFFYSREANEPPHIHVEKGGATAKCWLDSVEIARIQGFNPNERRRILALVGDHRDQLLESWDEFFHQNPPSGRR